MTKPIDNLREALFASGLVIPLSGSSKATSISLLCRPMPGQDQNWLKVVEIILKQVDAKPFEQDGTVDVHLGRQYVLKNGSMAAGWFIGITVSKKVLLEKAVDLIKESISSAVFETVSAEDEEVPSRAPRPGYKSPYREMDPRLNAQLSGAPSHVKELRGRTTSHPRAMEHTDDPVIPDRDVRLVTTVSRIRTTKDGKQIRETHQVIPLAHVYGELNPENENGRGAFSDVDSATPKILRNRR